MKYSSLTDKTVSVLGGSSGIGRGAALRFAEEGARVVIAARREKELSEVVAEVRARWRRGVCRH